MILLSKWAEGYPRINSCKCAILPSTLLFATVSLLRTVICFKWSFIMLSKKPTRNRGNCDEGGIAISADIDKSIISAHVSLINTNKSLDPRRHDGSGTKHPEIISTNKSNIDWDISSFFLPYLIFNFILSFHSVPVIISLTADSTSKL